MDGHLRLMRCQRRRHQTAETHSVFRLHTSKDSNALTFFQARVEGCTAMNEAHAVKWNGRHGMPWGVDGLLVILWSQVKMINCI